MKKLKPDFTFTIDLENVLIDHFKGRMIGPSKYHTYEHEIRVSDGMKGIYKITVERIS